MFSNQVASTAIEKDEVGYVSTDRHCLTMCERNETMAKRTAPTSGREEYRRMPQRRRAASRTQESAALAAERNIMAVYLTIGTLAGGGVALAHDTRSNPTTTTPGRI